MPTRTEPVNSTSVNIAGISCVSGGDVFCNSARNYNQVSRSMKDYRKNISTHSTQQSTGVYSMTDSAPQRVHSRKQSNRDEVLTQDEIIYKISRSQSAYVHPIQRGSVSTPDTARLYNMNARNSKTGLPKRHTVRPKTALGFRERTKSLGIPGRSPPSISMSFDPNIPITSNWAQTGSKHLDEEKIQDLYRRYLGREYRVKLIKGEQEDNEDGGDNGEVNNNEHIHDDNTVAADTPQGWLQDGDKNTQNKENTIELNTPAIPSRRPSIDFSGMNQVFGVDRAIRKPFMKFRKTKLQAEASPRIEVETPQGTIQLPQLPRRREGRRRSSAPTLKVACSVEFETAFKGLNVS